MQYQTRILLISPYFYPHKGGSQQYAEELHYHLMKADPTVKVDVICYNTDNQAEVEEHRGFTIYRVPCFQILKGQFALPNYFKLWELLHKLFKKNRYTFINSHTRFFDNSWWVPFVARYFNTKAVLTDHCATHPTHTSKFVNMVARTVDTMVVPIITGKYSVITVTNSATQTFLGSLGVKISHLIYGGVDTKYFTPKKRTGRRKFPGTDRVFTRNDTVITFVGRMINSKGPQLLLQSVETLLKKNPRLYVVFAGDGPLLTKLSKNTSDHIIFTGSLPKQKVAKLMANSDIIVHPSLHHEGFPNVLLEAQASGCAVIATNRGGSYEIIQDKTTGMLIEPDIKHIKKALKTLLDNTSLRKQLAQSGREQVERLYDWRKIVKQYQEVIDQDIKHPLVLPSMRVSRIPVNKRLNAAR